MTKNFVHGILASLRKKSLKENFQQKQEKKVIAVVVNFKPR